MKQTEDEHREKSQGSHTAASQPAPDGSPDGSAEPTGGSPDRLAEGESQARLPDDGPAESSDRAEPPSAASLLGLPDGLPPTWCPNCKADVTPRGKGQCPRCGRVLKQSFLARRHPVNLLRRRALLDQLVAEYGPRTTLQRATCEHLAGVLEQLEVMKPGGTEHQRLVQLAQTLGKELEAVRAGRVAPETLVVRRVIIDPKAEADDAPLPAPAPVAPSPEREDPKPPRRRRLELVPSRETAADAPVTADVPAVEVRPGHPPRPAVIDQDKTNEMLQRLGAPAPDWWSKLP